MRILCVLLSILLSPLAWADTLVIQHVAVIDATGRAAQPNMTVVIEGLHIVSVGPTKKTVVPNGAQLLDGSGKFLIPGLWDMHVHWSDTAYLPLFLANGVTGIRIMWGESVHHEWKRRSQAGTLLAPHLYIASPIIDGPKPAFPDSVSVADENQAHQAVIDAKLGGADFIKVLSFLPRAEYFAVADEAKRQGLSFVGHVPLSVSAEEASNAGQKSFEHLLGVLQACSTREHDLDEAARADLDDILSGTERSRWGRHRQALRQAELDTYNPDKGTTLFALLKRNGTWQCPTLTVLHAIASLDDPTFTDDPRLKYMPRWTHTAWDPAGARVHYEVNSSNNIELSKKEFAKDLELVAALQKAGVGILAGTDTSNAFCMPGFSLHDELGLMVRAGLTPLQALQTATLNPARFMGRDKDLGTIEKNKVADLVLLDANPLDDIANTRKISSVIYGGRLFTRAQLDQMLADVATEAARLPIAPVLGKTIHERGISAAVQQYHDLKATQPTMYDYGAEELIGLGYGLLKAQQVAGAVEIFKLSVEAAPDYYNAYDSLAEAYVALGDKQLAVRNYRRSLELNPHNTNAVERLRELNAH